MKTLIVDDEQHVIDAIQMLVPWEKHGISKVITAQSVSQAIGLLDSERPDIAIVDVVIGDELGMDVLKHIREKNLPTKALVISGHDNYQYIRAMFVLDAVDYLLKPIVPEELEAVVAKVVDQIRGMDQKPETPFSVDRQLKHLFPDHQHALMRKLFQPDLRDVSYQELCHINPYIQKANTCVILFCSGLFLPIYSKEYVIELSSFLNALQNRLEEKNYGSLFQRNDPAPDVVILLYRDIDTGRDIVRKACQEFNATHGDHLRLGDSGRCAFPSEIAKAWDCAELAFDCSWFDDASLICPHDPAMTAMSRKVNLNLENQVISALSTTSETQYRSSVSKWIDDIMKDMPHTRGSLRCLWGTLTDMKRRICAYFEIPMTTQEVTSALAEKQYAQAVSKMCKEFTDSCWTLVKEKEVDSGGKMWVEQLAQMLEADYAKNFRQQEYAEKLHLNKDYMSRKFKEHYGMGMVAYLNEIRIRKAKELLRNTDLRIQEIADSTGYFDSKYFSQQFKKLVGCSPNEYRNKKKKI